MERIIFLLLGTVLIVLGFGIIIEPKYQHVISGYLFDFTAYNIPFGIFMIIVGALLLWTSLKTKNEKKNK